MKGEIFSLRRLRWKLTLSYTLVVVVTLLVLELLLAGALLAFLNSELPPRIVAQQLRDEVVPRLERPLNQSPPDTGEIRRELATFGEGSDGRGAGEARPGAPHGLYGGGRRLALCSGRRAAAAGQRARA